ncbi:MAG: GTPase HflX [Oscillospiraceae bacterium]|nr:GTPase HflX [Oscillospiraceae bacterium]
MFETKETTVQRALLVAVDTGEYDVEESLDELAELARSAGAEVAARVTQRRESFDPATCIGAGRLEEMADFIEADGANLIIFDHELTASQLRNIEKACGCDVIDRTTLILDIFAQRATTSEGRLQVELAQQRYRLPRLTGLGTSLSRLGGGIGTRGPGETKLESDRRHIRSRINSLERQLETLARRRELMHTRRKKEGVVTVAIVGYTNVGKSTLLNRLTDAGVLSENMLFATLDPTSRALELPDGRTVMLVDTVGLVRRLPHHLVEAFKSTLEEAAQADLLLNVCDISSPEAEAHLQVTQQLLKDLGAENIPILTVLNKCDKLAYEPLDLGRNSVLISAQTGYGIDALLQSICRLLPATQQRLTLLLPYAQGGLENHIVETGGKIFSRDYTEEGILLDALVDSKELHRVAEFVQRDPKG